MKKAERAHQKAVKAQIAVCNNWSRAYYHGGSCRISDRFEEEVEKLKAMLTFTEHLYSRWIPSEGYGEFYIVKEG